MNKVKYFLGATCLFIAVAASMATRATTVTLPYYYYVNPNATTKVCAEVTIPAECGAPGAGCEYDIPGIGIRQLYDVRTSSSVCNTPLQEFTN